MSPDGVPKSVMCLLSGTNHNPVRTGVWKFALVKNMTESCKSEQMQPPSFINIFRLPSEHRASPGSQPSRPVGELVMLLFGQHCLETAQSCALSQGQEEA